MKKLFYFFALALFSSTNFAQIITTIAGTGVQGYSGDGGPATSARLFQPTTLAVDATGNVYFADDGNNVVRKINTSGIITTVAGTGVAGYSGDGGPATAAQLYAPWGVRVDAAGNLYIADALNNVIRKVNTAGIITTIAGTGVAGYSGDGGPATAAQLNFCSGVAVDAAGNVYISDDNNDFIRKVDVSGIITTIAGNGTCGYTGDGGAATSAQLCFPVGIQTDATGNLYISDNVNCVVRKVNTTTGIISTIAGNGTPGYSGDGGPATSARLQYNFDVTFDAAGNFFIADWGNSVVRKVNTSGIISTYAGNGGTGYSGDGGVATSAQLNGPLGVTLDTAGNLYIADWGNNVVRKVSVPVSTLSITPGNTCATAYALNTLSGPSSGSINVLQPGSVTQSFNDGYFTVYAVSNNITIGVNFSNDSAQWQVKKMVVAMGSCSSFTVIGIDSLISANDTSLQLRITNVTPGTLFYIKLTKGSLYTCTTCKITDNLSYKLYYKVEAGYVTIAVPGCYGYPLGGGGGVCSSGPVSVGCNLTICAGTTLNNVIVDMNAGTAAYYHYNSSTGLIILPTTTGITAVGGPTHYNITFGLNCAPGTYTLQGIFSGGSTQDCIPPDMGGPSICWGAFCSEYVVITVLPNPLNPVLNVNPNPVCEGAYVSFTFGNQPSTPTNYIFSTGASGSGNTYTGTTPVGSSNFSNLCPYPTSGTYNATLTYANSIGCTKSTVTQVMVTPMQANITFTQNCDVFHFFANPTGACTTGVIYSWNFGDGTFGSGQNPPLHIYTGAGPYTVTLTMSTTSCSLVSAIFTTVVHPVSNCCTNTPPAGTGSLYPRVPVSVASSTSHIVGLSGSGTLNINNNDFTAQAGTSTNPTIIKIVSPTSNSANATINFNNCTFLMFPGSKILIYTNSTNNVGCSEASTLTVNFNNCHLFGCAQLWEGISFDHANFPVTACGKDFVAFTFNTILNINNTLLEDAYKGVDNSNYQISTTGPLVSNLIFTTTKSMYNKNYIDLFLDQNRLIYNSFSKSSSYTCRQITYKPPFTPLPTFSTNASSYYSNVLNLTSAANVLPSSIHSLSSSPKGYNAIQLFFNSTTSSNVPQIFDLYTNQNIYDRHNTGIFNGNSSSKNCVNLTIGRQYFLNLYYGVLSNGWQIGNQGAPPNLTIGTNAADANTFGECVEGIWSFFKTNQITASYNIFRDIDNAISVYNFGTASTNTNCNIVANQIKNPRLEAIFFYQSSSINANVQFNQISFSGSPSYLSKGIAVNEMGSPNAQYNIDQNNISTHTGIECSGTNSSQITNNTIQIYTPPNTSFGYNYGINNTNCYNNTIGNNIITGDNNQSHTWQFGINSTLHPAQNIFCNVITGTSTGLHLQDISQTAANLPIRNNELHEQLIDVWMDNNCILGSQGVFFNIFNLHLQFPVDNTFYHSTPYTSSYCSGNPNPTFGNLSPFYIQGSGNYIMPFNTAQPTPHSIAMTPVIIGGGFPSPCNANGGGFGHRLLNLARQVALDSLFPPAALRNTFVSHQTLFANLLLENISTAGDPVLTNFKNTQATGNLGTLFTINTKINNSIKNNNPVLLTQAQSLNNNLFPTDTFELLHKQVNTAYINFLTNGNTFTSADLSTLKQIAILCPFTNGSAVWQARSLLSGIDSTQYSNTCETIVPPSSSGQRLAQTNNSDVAVQNSDIGIYPNPNSGSFNVSLTGKFKQLNIEVYNMLGDLVLSKQFTQENANVIKVEGLEVGVYMVKIITDGTLVKTERVIVAK